MLMSGMKRPGGIFGAPMQTTGTPPIAPPTGGYQKPDTLHTIAGVLGDTLATIGGGQGTFLPMMARQQEMMQREQQAQSQRAAEYADWQRKEEWKRANPAPVNNDTVNDYNFILEKQGQAAADQYLRAVAAGPPVAVDGVDAQGNQTRTYLPRGQLYGGGSPAPMAPPAGVTFTPLPPVGGATPGGSRTFR